MAIRWLNEELENPVSKSDIVRDWYDAQYPKENAYRGHAHELDDITFEDVMWYLENRDTDCFWIMPDNYEVRQRIFRKLAEIYDTTYDTIQDMWREIDDMLDAKYGD